MTTSTRPAANSTPEQLRFPPAASYTIQADFTGGEISSDLGALLLSAVDRHIIDSARFIRESPSLNCS